MRIVFSLAASLFLFFPDTFAQKRSKEVLLPLLNQKVVAQQIDTQRVNVLNELSWAYHRSDVDSSRLFAETALKFATDLEYAYGRARAFNHLANYYSNQGMSLKAMALNDSCYNIATIISDSFLISSALNNNANIKSSFGLQAEALKDYNKSLEYTPQNDLLGRIFTMGNIGLTYQELGDSTNAEKYFLKSTQLAGGASDPFIKAAAIQDYINYLFNKKDFKGVRENAQKAIRLAKIHQDNVSIITAYIFLGDINLQEKLFESSFNYFKKAEEIAISSKLNEQLIYIYGSMAELSNQQKKPDKAIFFANKIIENIIDKETQDANPWIFELYAEAYKTKGDFEKAYEYQKIFAAKTDSLSSKNLEEKIYNIMIINELELEKKEKEKLKNEQAEQKKALSYQKKFTHALLFVGFLALSLIIVLFSAYRYKNRYNEQLKLKVKQQTASLQQKNTALASSNKELENFTHITSHDLKEPIRNILSFSKMLIDKQDNLTNDQIRQYIQIVYSRAKRVHILLEDVLEFSKISKGIQQVGWIEPNEVIHNIQEELESLFKEKNVLIKLEDIPPIHFGETELFLILKNLIENGIKYNISEQPTLHIGYKAENSYHHFSVQDNGIGIEKGYERKIFNMFFRLHNKQDFEGTGLGLAICKKILDKVNGKIWLKSQVGKGSTFHFSIPIIQEHE